MIEPCPEETRRAVDEPRRAVRPPVRLDTSLEMLLNRIRADDTAKVIATLVATSGSTYRKPGARMLIMADGSHLGLLSGGCLEADLKLHADQVMDTGIAQAVEYDMRGPDDILFGLGAGCEGAMRVLLEPAGAGTRAAAALAAAGPTIDAGMPTSLVIVHESTELPLGTYAAAAPLTHELMAAGERSLVVAASADLWVETGGRSTRAFVQFLPPRPHLLICGAGPDVVPVAAMAGGLGWRVSIVDHRATYAVTASFPGASVHVSHPAALRRVVDLDHCHAAVVMSHHLPSDTLYLRELAEAGAPHYVGLLGPAARRQRLADELGSAAATLGARLHGPVGLNLGAVTPEGIALSVISQIHAWLAGRDSSF